MITFSELIGGLLKLVLAKVVDHKLDAALDTKRQVAGALMRLYQAITDLERSTGGVIDFLNSPAGDRNVDTLFEIDSGITAASDAFTDIAKRLVGALRVFDPALARTLEDVALHKTSLLTLASMGFEVSYEGDKSGAIEVKYFTPSKRLSGIDFPSHYEWVQANPSCPFENLEWPQSVIIGWDSDQEIEEDRVMFCNLIDNPPNAKVLMERLQHHHIVLRECRDLLAAHIRENFSIVDVL